MGSHPRGRLSILPSEVSGVEGEEGAVRRRAEAAVGAEVQRFEKGRARTAADRVAAEEPLEIRLRGAGEAGEEKVVAVTMRTPGDDLELAAGFLFAEGVIAGAGDLAGLAHSDPAGNVVVARLAAGRAPDLRGLERHFFASSACGVCGKAGLETLSLRGLAPPPPGPVVAPAALTAMPAALRRAQGVFEATGGLHAAALFTPGGGLVAVREDVGRHNALDKLVGWALAAGRVPLAGGVVLVSGRSSFEILQKCLVAGAPVVCSVSAPSSLAVDLARRFGVTLVGFLRAGRFNVYSRPDRIAGGG